MRNQIFLIVGMCHLWLQLMQTIVPNFFYFRSYRQRCPIKKSWSQKFRNIHRKTSVLEPFFNKVEGLNIFLKNIFERFLLSDCCKCELWETAEAYLGPSQSFMIESFWKNSKIMICLSTLWKLHYFLISRIVAYLFSTSSISSIWCFLV